MAELLLRAFDSTHPDPDTDKSGCYKAGDIVDVKGDNWTWGNQERLPKFIVVKIPNVDPSTIMHYMEQWHHRIEWNQVAYSLAQDGYRLEVYAQEDLVKADGTNALTRTAVESWLQKWNGSVVSVVNRRVRFDIGVYQAMTSLGFFNVANLDNVTFTKLSGDGNSGSYQITADWSTHGWSQKQVEQRIKEMGGVIDNGSVGVTTYTISRASVINAFKQAVRQALEKIYMRRRFHVSAGDVATAIGLGGVVTLTPAQALAKVLNKVTE